MVDSLASLGKPAHPEVNFIKLSLSETYICKCFPFVSVACRRFTPHLLGLHQVHVWYNFIATCQSPQSDNGTSTLLLTPSTTSLQHAVTCHHIQSVNHNEHVPKNHLQYGTILRNLSSRSSITDQLNIGSFVFLSRFVTATMFVKNKSNKKGLEISSPSNFQHRVHTGFDREQGVFVGLPAQWAGIIGNDTSRPRPIIDPSHITQMEVTPLKVNSFFSFCSPVLFTHVI